MLRESKENITKKWEISIMELEYENGKKYKVTRHNPKMSVLETKFFLSKEDAKKQFEEWLNS